MSDRLTKTLGFDPPLIFRADTAVAPKIKNLCFPPSLVNKDRNEFSKLFFKIDEEGGIFEWQPRRREWKSLLLDRNM